MSQEKKKGRPEKPAQTRPLIFERARSRVTRPVSMSAKTADDLARYVAWAANTVGADEDEAMTLTLDQAIGQFLQRDKLFQDSLKERPDDEGAGTGDGSTSGPSVATKNTPPAAVSSTARAGTSL
jgi:hypothetical protein